MSDKMQGYWSLKPSRFRFLESMVLRRRIGSDAAEPYVLVLTLKDSASESAVRATLRCDGVRGLKVGDLEGLVGMLFEISDVSDRQLEGISYRVMETENDCFELFCSDFMFEILE